MSNYTYAERDVEFAQEEKVEYYEDWKNFGHGRGDEEWDQLIENVRQAPLTLSWHSQ